MTLQSSKPLRLTILSPDATLFEGEAQTISCHNPKGSFDVLYEHTNFMSMIDTEVSIVDMNGASRSIPIEQALIQVIDNVVTILVNVQFTQKETLLEKLFGKKS
ncbi:hypothetical protein KBD81_00645 [Candidatus Woesebacteria bacterium]|nr:hypothetical protein [Candidatus Woesebacteria bacterium]